MDRLLLIDGSNLLFQMFYGMPSRIVNREGKAIHGTLGFVGALLNMVRILCPTHVAVFFDGEHENHRTALDSSYKANRNEDKRRGDDLPFSQLSDVCAALSYLRIPYAETTNCETDDWMAGYAIRYGSDSQIVIASMDSDYFQLINDNVSVFRYRGKNSTMCDEVFFRKRFCIAPEQYADHKALTGDPSDNIPGVPGIGPKTAAQLLNEYGTLKLILENLDSIQRSSIRESLAKSEERVRLNHELIRLKGDKAIPFTKTDMKWNDNNLTTIQVLTEVGLY